MHQPLDFSVYCQLILTFLKNLQFGSTALKDGKYQIGSYILMNWQQSRLPNPCSQMQKISQIRHGRKFNSMQFMPRRKRIFQSKKFVSSFWKNALRHQNSRESQKMRNSQRTRNSERLRNLRNSHFETELDKSLETLSKVQRVNPEIEMSTLQ